MTEKGKNTPTVRFKGFTDAWEQRKLGDLGKARSGIGFPDAEQGGKEGVPFYKVSDMNNAGNEHEMVTANNYVTREQIVRKGWKPIDEVPAIFFAKVGAAIMLNRKRLCRTPFLLDNNTMAYSMDGSVLDGDFAKTLFETIDLTSLVQVGALPSYNSGDVENIDAVIPEMNEQKAIGSYFKSLDRLIALHQRHLDEQKALKKYFLQNMFPAKGEKAPRIRFQGFTGDWEQRKLGEITKEKLSNGIANNQSDVPTELRHINVIDMYTPDRIHTNKLTYSKYGEAEIEKCHVEYGDIFMTRSSVKPEGIAEANVLLDSGKYVYDDHLIRLKIIPNVYDPIFVKINLGNWMIKSQFIQKSKTTAFTTIGQDDIASCSGMFPGYQEQQKISRYFTNLDHLIALHQRQLTQLQAVKKFMLQNLFI